MRSAYRSKDVSKRRPAHDTKAPGGHRSAHDTKAPGGHRSAHDTKAPGGHRSAHDTKAPGGHRSAHDTKAPGGHRSAHDTKVSGSHRSAHDTKAPGSLRPAHDTKAPDDHRVQHEPSKIPTTTGGLLSINIDNGDIRGLKVDAYVCSVHRSKDMSKRRLSSDIKDRGGRKIQDELNETNRGRDLHHGEVVVTGPGNLQSQIKLIMFVCLYTWRDGNEKTLTEAIIRCLEIASEKGFQSIAIPALGMGRQHYPPHNVAMSILVAILQFVKDNPESSVCNIHIVVHDKEFSSTFRHTCEAYLKGVEGGRAMTNANQTDIGTVNSTKESQNDQDNGTQATCSQETFKQTPVHGNLLSVSKSLGPVAVNAGVGVSLSNMTVGLKGELVVDLSKYVPRPVKVFIQKVRDLF